MQKLTNDELITLLTKPPASFVWATKEGRTIGTSEGFILDFWPDRVEAAAIFAPNDTRMAARNSMLFLLILSALRPDWNSISDWLTIQMRLGARYTPTDDEPLFQADNGTRRVRFTWDQLHSRATLTVMQ